MNTFDTMHLSFRGLTTLVVLCGSLAAGQVLAGPTDDPPTVTVSFADLDLSKPTGAETLYQRIQAAARTVCGGSRHTRDLNVRQASRTCYEKAIDDALKQVNESNLFEARVAAQ